MTTQLKLDSVVFPAVQVPSADPNTLDDYEEGTWVPALTFGTSGSVTYNGGLTAGRYTKVGRLVVVSGYIVLSALTSPTGIVKIGGLPFSAPAGVYTAAIIVGANLSAAITSALMGRIAESASAIDVFKPAAGGFALFLGSDLTAASEFYISASYTV
jgi:hypothetical protein